MGNTLCSSSSFLHSKLSIVTHHSSQAAATRLEYDHNGRLLSKNPCARDVGTTVSLQSLFSTLPVRHREFLRNIKREFSKLVHVLQGYCLVSTGIRITCSNQVEKGKKTTIVSTNGSEQVKDNITCVFGPKQVGETCCSVVNCPAGIQLKYYIMKLLLLWQSFELYAVRSHIHPDALLPSFFTLQCSSTEVCLSSRLPRNLAKLLVLARAS